MYRILLVDDEPYITDSLQEYLQSVESLELDIYKAYSAEEALGILDNIKIDIVLTDIRMPEISGLELHRQITQRWPHCQVIFLSGYDDFDYVQQSVRTGGVIDYILKTDEDERVVEAIQKAIAKLEARSDHHDILQKAKYNLKQAEPLLQKEYMTMMLREPSKRQEERVRQFQDLNLPLDGNEGVLLLVGRIDGWQEGITLSEKTLLFYAVHNIAQELFAPIARFYHIDYENRYFIWFIQAAEGVAPASRTVLIGTIETVQSTINRYLRLSISVVLGRQETDWMRVGETYDTLKFILNNEISGYPEMLFIDEASMVMDQSGANESLMRRSTEQQLRYKLKNIHMLEQGNEASVLERLVELKTELAAAPLNLQLELFLTMSVEFLSFMNRKGFAHLAASHISFDKLTRFDSHDSWQDACQYFEYTARQLLKFTVNESAQRQDQLIGRIHSYIHSHLKDDLSLVRIADVVHLHPFYLSRIYVQYTGSNLSDYITETRMAKAQELLLYSDLKIHEISSEIGYEFPPSFTRLFKKLYHITPQQYRERGLSM